MCLCLLSVFGFLCVFFVCVSGTSKVIEKNGTGSGGRIGRLCAEDCGFESMVESNQ